jgi:enamine deaminase RidA (YjgF/YER057c/UK114 family)
MSLEQPRVAMRRPPTPMARPRTSSFRSALEEVGARLEDVVRTVICVTNIGDADLVGRAHREAFGDIRPASTMVQMSGLIRPEILVEIDAYAVIDKT